MRWLKALDRRLLLSIAGVCSWPAMVIADAADGAVIYVPRTVIYPGDVIADEAIIEQPRNPIGSTKSAPLAKREDIVGKVARRTLLRGEPIPASALRDKEVVVQGRTYSLIYKSESLTVVGNGVPLQSAAANQIINVRNPDTGVVVKARVQADETLLVDVQ